MIKIELQFETGAEARKALEELLGNSTQIVEHHIQMDEKAIKDEKIAENFEAPKTETPTAEKPAEEIVSGKKRRTKAEIEAEKTAAITQEEKPADDTAETQLQDNKAQNAVTKEMLQGKAVNLIRNSKKDAVVAVLKKFGADSIAQADKNPLKVEDYSAVMDELNKL